jgi:cold shock CspA family protein
MVFGKIISVRPDFYFIKRDDNAPDVFLGARQLEIDGLKPLKLGERERFDVQASNRGHRAFNVMVV